VLTDDGFTRLVAAAPTHVRGVRAHLVDRLSARQLANIAGALGGIAADGAAPVDDVDDLDDGAGGNVSGAAGRARARR
jgi:hypothetical protein